MNNIGLACIFICTYTFLQCGVVTSSAMPLLAALPNRKMIDNKY